MNQKTLPEAQDTGSESQEPHVDTDAAALDVAAGVSGDEEDDEHYGSLSEDILALIEDGRTYAEAEAAFQKSRASFAAHSAGTGAILVIAAFGFFHLALIGLVVGVIFALEPLLTIWGAIAVVVGLLLAGGALLAIIAKKRFRKMTNAFRKTPK